MCKSFPPPAVSRRRFLVQSLASASTLGLGMATPAFGQTNQVDERRTPEAAIEALLDGNERYVQGEPLSRDLDELRDHVRAGQRPLAAVLSCSDARSAPEVIFDQALGALYVVRIAGNSVDPGVLASMEYAVTLMRVPLVLVLGHTGCGVVAAAIRQVATGRQMPGHIDAITAPIAPAVNAARHEAGARRLEATIRENVLLNVQRLTRANLLAPAIAEERLHVLGGVYDVLSGRVTMLEE